MKQGSRIRLIPFASQRERIAIAASPEPRKIAFTRKRRMMVAFPPSITAV